MLQQGLYICEIYQSCAKYAELRRLTWQSTLPAYSSTQVNAETLHLCERASVRTIVCLCHLAETQMSAYT